MCPFSLFPTIMSVRGGGVAIGADLSSVSDPVSCGENLGTLSDVVSHGSKQVRARRNAGVFFGGGASRCFTRYQKRKSSTRLRQKTGIGICKRASTSRSVSDFNSLLRLCTVCNKPHGPPVLGRCWEILDLI